MIRTPLGTRLLADPINPAIGDALATRGIALGRGQVILGCAATHEHAVLDEIRRVGADYQLIGQLSG